MGPVMGLEIGFAIALPAVTPTISSPSRTANNGFHFTGSTSFSVFALNF